MSLGQVRATVVVHGPRRRTALARPRLLPGCLTSENGAGTTRALMPPKPSRGLVREPRVGHPASPIVQLPQRGF